MILKSQVTFFFLVYNDQVSGLCETAGAISKQADLSVNHVLCVPALRLFSTLHDTSGGIEVINFNVDVDTFHIDSCNLENRT